jgi:hypothetical protein
MDYKKRNEEILEKLRALRDSWASTNNRAAKEIEEAIPELIESEDERIRKEIIDFATKANNGVTSILANNYNFNKWIALLEKRAEQKTVVIIPKFRVGDKIRRKTPRRYDKDMQVSRIGSNYYLCNHLGKFSSESISFSEESNYELVEQKPAEWSDEDEEIVEALNNYVKNLDILFSEIKIGNKDILSKEFREKVQSWLKSLKERVQFQPQWKPSVEQMIALKCAITTADEKWVCMNTKDLESLYEDLKKLQD